MSAASNSYLSPVEYLEIERASLDAKHEYHAGEMFQMAGASRQHNRITFNLTGLVFNAVRGGASEAYATDMRVKVDPTGLYTYPDLVVTCEEPTFEDEHVDTLTNPQVIVEVLSDSTEGYDRGKKFEHYRQIESLREYLLLSQGKPHIERFVRDDNGSWVLTEARGGEASITVATLDLPLALADVYAKVDFKPAGSEE